jgi:hypothetical protein
MESIRVNDAGDRVKIPYWQSIDIDSGKHIVYSDEYPRGSVVLDTNRLVCINGKSPSGRGGVDYFGRTTSGRVDSFHGYITIIPDNPLESGDVITFKRDWFFVSVSEYDSFSKSEWYKVRIVTESLIFQ